MTDHQTIDRNGYFPNSAGVLCGIGIGTVRRDNPFNATIVVELSDDDGKSWRRKPFLTRQKYESFVFSRPTRLRVAVSEWSGPFKLRLGVPG